MQFARRFPVILILLAGGTLRAQTQQCPKDQRDNFPTSITGMLDYHPGVYAWYGVRPAQPVCEQKVIQLDLNDHTAFLEAHRFVGCEVTVTGNLFLPGNGYWSVELGIADAHLQPGKTCKPGQPLPDYSAVPIPPALHRYKVVASYDTKTEIFSAQAFDASGKSLSPWQAYASDTGNGARDLQRMFCAEGFAASDPKDTNGQPNLQANADPDFPQAIEVALPNDSIVQVSFACTRSGRTKKE